MKRISLLFLSFLLTFLLVLRAQEPTKGISFFHGSFKEALDKAQKEKKLVFVDFFTTWCGPCKRMARDIFTQDSVGAYFNEHFVSVKLDAEKSENADVVKQYKVEAFPTLVFLNAEGKTLHLNAGMLNGEELLEAARIAAGETVSFEQLYDQHRKSPSDLAIQQALLLKAPAFLSTLEGMDAEKWVLRLRKLYTNYIATKKDEALINRQDYIIITTLGGDDRKEKLEMVEFVNANLPAWRKAVGNAAAYYVVEGIDAHIEDLVKAGDASYKSFVDRVATDYAGAYSVMELENITPAERVKLESDALFQLYKHKNVEEYLRLSKQLIEKLGDNISPSHYGKLAQTLYYAAADKLNKEQHEQAIAWLQTALQAENVVMNRVNYITMMGDSQRAMKNYAKARECYNQAFAESLQMGEQEMVQAMVQATVQKKLAELELLEK